jgi:cytochrome c-type biogenesis protein CcmF
MVNFGDSLFYASIVTGFIALLGLLLKEFKNSDVLTRIVSPLILLSTGLLSFAYVLITYYFIIGDFTFEYVWQYSSRGLPLVYKISGVWAGQPGTYLLWVLVIFTSASWLALTTKHATTIARRTQMITLLIGLYLIILTIIQTPFKSIYESNPSLAGFVPPDGSGLNALLVNFWMIVHPPLMFIGYGAITIPFASALVYLITKEDGWEELSRQWARFTWLFLGMGIAVGGVWAYFILGWGGFWAWDPVETASFIPWLTLTGFLHATSLHRKNKQIFSIAAPILAAVSFVLVLYAALVVRSGLFNSVHAFGETSTGTLLIMAVLICAFVTIVLGMRRYLGEPESAEEWTLWSKKNIFYISILAFTVLAFISFWGITFPAFIQLTQNVKVNVASDTKNFFNVWSFPFTLIMLLALGFCLNYKESEKEKQKKTLLIVTALTVLAMFLRNGDFYVLDHSSPFFVREPDLYKILGSISVFSIFPPLIYALASTIERLSGYLHIGIMRPKIKGIGIAAIHFGVVFILFGAVISSSFTHTVEGINIPLLAKGEKVAVGDDYSIKVVDVTTRSLAESNYSGGTRISDILNHPENYGSNSVVVSGSVGDVLNSQTKTEPVTYTTYLEINDGTGNLWAATQTDTPLSIPADTKLTVTGFLTSGFKSSSINRTFDLIILASPNDISESTASGQYKVQSVKLEVYQKDNMIGSGIAEYLEGKGSGTFPMVSSSITGTDVYVIFQGIGGGYVPLTLKIIPAINFAWLGIVLFAVGIILIMAMKTRRRQDE